MKTKLNKGRFLLVASILIIIICLISMNFTKVLIILMSGGKVIKDQEDVTISENAEWFDDYFTLEYLDERTIAIGEPRYYQKNFTYLLIGDSQAVLFDAGTGYRDLEPLVRSLTDLPVTVLLSHFHFDHLGNANNFDKLLLTEIQLDKQAILDNDRFIPSHDSFLGEAENLFEPILYPDEILPNDVSLDIGNRTLHLLSAPGHARNSIVLYDSTSNLLFTGDYLIPSFLATSRLIVPDGSLKEAKETALKLKDVISEKTILYGAHSVDNTLPILRYKDIEDLANFLNQDTIKEGLLPKFKKINDKMYILY